MKSSYVVIAVLVLLLGLGGLAFFKVKSFLSGSGPRPTPTPAPAARQLTPDEFPEVSMEFTKDAHYVNVNITKINAPQLEYNLIYDATVKKDRIQTGVNATAKLDGAKTYSKQQLLGSESSGKFSYHTNIQNAVMELTLRDDLGRSVFTATYPFEVKPGQTLKLSPR